MSILRRGPEKREVVLSTHLTPTNPGAQFYPPQVNQVNDIKQPSGTMSKPATRVYPTGLFGHKLLCPVMNALALVA